MSGRFPFDQPGGGRQPQMNPAQLRAALGLLPAAEDAFYLQQQHQQHAQQQQHQHDVHLRRLLLQEQQHAMQEQQLRNLGEIHEYPDLQQRLQRSLLLSEQLAAQQLGSAPSQLHHQQQQQQQQQAAFIREQARLRMHAEEQMLLRHQQSQQLGAGFRGDDMAQPPSSQLEVLNQQRQQPLSPGRLGSSPFDVHALETNAAAKSISALEGLQEDHQRQQNEQQIQLQREDQLKAFLSTINGQGNEAIIKQALEQQKKIQQLPPPSLQKSFSRGAGSDDSSSHQPGPPKHVTPSTPTSKKTKIKRAREQEETKAVPNEINEGVTSPRSLNLKKEKKKRRTKAEMEAAKAAEADSTMSRKRVKAPPRLADHPPPSLPLLALDVKPAAEIDRGHSDIDTSTNTRDHEMDYSARSAYSCRSHASDKDQERKAQGALEAFLQAADGARPVEIAEEEPLYQKGTVTNLLDIANEYSKIDEAAEVLVFNVGKAETMSESEADSSDDDDEYKPEQETFGLPARRDLKTELFLSPESADQTTTFISRIPQLPDEPVFPQDLFGGNPTKGLIDRENGKKSEKTLHDDPLGSCSSHSKSKGKKSPTVLEYPYPIDTWWPSISGMRKELKNAGEASDEDNFEETPSPYGVQTLFRANEKKIRSRLANSLEPGVLEKLPHCMIHRVRTKRKKNSTAPELVYCWQVTEIYPNDIMTNCSKCGTWRHAACGGHYKPFSTRENTFTPFVAICDFCSEEERFLHDYKVGERRLERQRMEQLRRGYATSAVMRHASFSKHGGTYKWPLGSVSATHIGGHTRSVHARHDKAEKQWTDMATRLGRGYGYRQKERIRSRTKELERLLVSIEDAEGYTERHNMMLFLLRDTVKEKPTGLENQVGNIFDPADDEIHQESDESDTAGISSSDEDYEEGDENCEAPKKQPEDPKQVHHPEQEEIDCGDSVVDLPSTNARLEACARIGCRNRRRFDSQFCSDACGVSCLEQDLLRTLQDASDIHPSVLRL